jgi:O-antigen/teichoic acid export membrane protein
MIAALALIGVFTALRYWTIRQGNFATIAKTTIGQHASRAIAQIALGLISAGSGELMAGEVIGRMAGVAKLYREEWSKIRNLLTGVSMGDLLHTLNANRRLLAYSLPSTCIDTLVANLPIPLLVKLYGIEAGGYYALVQKVLGLPLALIATSVADTFHSSLAMRARDSPSTMLQLFKRTSLWLFAIGLPPAIILGTLGDPLFRMIFGHQWGMAGALAALSTPWFLTQFIVSPLSRLVFVLSGQQAKLIYDVVILVGMSAVAILSFHLGWNIYKTVWAFSLMNTAAYVVYYVILLGIMMKATPIPDCEMRG